MYFLWSISVFILVSPILGQNPEGEEVDPSTGLAKSIKEKMLNLHNEIRRKQGASNMNELEWSEELAKHSKQWADECKFTHDYSADAKNSKLWPQSQNLYATTGSSNLYGAVPIWAAEKGYYNYDTLTCQAGKPCGHYTLVVWNSVKLVGCAYAKCPTLVRDKKSPFTNANYVVCQYWPAGNYAGAKPFEKGKPCSDCNNGLAFCKDNLCQPKCKGTSADCPCLADVPCPYCQKRDSSTCKCQCGPGFRGEKCDDICWDPQPTCAMYAKHPPQFVPKICAHPSIKRICKAFCGSCKKNTDKSWKCGSLTWENFFSIFAAGAKKIGSCEYPYKYNGKWYKQGECFEQHGKKWCSVTSNYDRYKTKSPCP